MKTFFTLISIILLSISTVYAQQVNEYSIPQKSLQLNLTWNYEDFTDSGVGTGFLIKPNDSIYLATCMHVLFQRKGAANLDLDRLIQMHLATHLEIVFYNELIKEVSAVIDIVDFSKSIKFIEDDITKKTVDFVLIPVSYKKELEKYIVPNSLITDYYDTNAITYSWGFPESKTPLKEPVKVLSYPSITKLELHNNKYYKPLLGLYKPGMSGSPIYTWRSGKYLLIGMAIGGEVTHNMRSGINSTKGVMLNFISVSQLFSKLP